VTPPPHKHPDLLVPAHERVALQEFIGILCSMEFTRGVFEEGIERSGEGYLCFIDLVYHFDTNTCISFDDAEDLGLKFAAWVPRPFPEKFMKMSLSNLMRMEWEGKPRLEMLIGSFFIDKLEQADWLLFFARGLAGRVMDKIWVSLPSFAVVKMLLTSPHPKP
jgi:hypothetical protein